MEEISTYVSYPMLGTPQLAAGQVTKFINVEFDMLQRILTRCVGRCRKNL